MSGELAFPLILAVVLLVVQKSLMHWRSYVKEQRDIRGPREGEGDVKLFTIERYNLLVMVPLALMIYGVIGEELSEVIVN